MKSRDMSLSTKEDRIAAALKKCVDACRPLQPSERRNVLRGLHVWYCENEHKTFDLEEEQNNDKSHD